eukprot:CAMPEP_0170518290 /NCGR_PEP_ID=MMETSP0209-20121228/4016_1 /TAXON_ID=665100 ORGANISM="Litonotus pictus, Strain P1" /NCGR_SAMPLE_ID=MMETSP0209 /ASSEMBLY_ACC=CAM_ASM_000301 /LENGTH=463 /DNA_ID=CAMNT_0010803793 /DNA_START=125 /DNA_END=1513 /DNA_ORIENTATION=+
MSGAPPAQKDLTDQINLLLSCSEKSSSEFGYSESMNYLLMDNMTGKARKRSKTISFFRAIVSEKGLSYNEIELQPKEMHTLDLLNEKNKIVMTGAKDWEVYCPLGRTFSDSYELCRKKGNRKDLSSLPPRVFNRASLEFFDRKETHTQRSNSQNNLFTSEVEEKLPSVCSKPVQDQEEQKMEDQKKQYEKKSAITSNYVYALTQQKDSQLFLSATAIPGKDFKQVVTHLEKDQEKVFSNFTTSLKQILNQEVSFNFFLSYYQALDSTSSALLLSALEFDSLIKHLPSSETFLILLKELKTDDHREIIFAKLNKCSIWRTFLETNKGKNLIIFILNSFLKRQTFIEKHLGEKLFSLFYEHFVELSLNKNSTFVIQAFIEHFPSQMLFDKVLYNISNLAFNRNGVFTLICALKAFNSKNLMERILNMTEVLYTDMYASTLIEQVFSMYECQAVEYFLKRKKDHLL